MKPLARSTANALASPQVLTLAVGERQRECIGLELADTTLTHCESVGALRVAMESHWAGLVLVGASALSRDGIPPLRSFVRENGTSCSIIGVLDHRSTWRSVVDDGMALGLAGISVAIDPCTREGGIAVREGLKRHAVGGAFITETMKQVLSDLEGLDDARRVVGGLMQPRSTIRKVARALGVLPSTLQSRAWRAGIRSLLEVKQEARLIWITRLAEGGKSAFATAMLTGESSSQSMLRFLREHGAGWRGWREFSERADTAAQVERFRRTMVLSRLDAWRRFALTTYTAVPRRAWGVTA